MAPAGSRPLELGELFDGLAHSSPDLAALVSARHRGGSGKRQPKSRGAMDT